MLYWSCFQSFQYDYRDEQHKATVFNHLSWKVGMCLLCLTLLCLLNSCLVGSTSQHAGVSVTQWEYITVICIWWIGEESWGTKYWRILCQSNDFGSGILNIFSNNNKTHRFWFLQIALAIFKSK